MQQRHHIAPTPPPQDDAGVIVMDEIVERTEDAGAFTGQVKWWNDRLGFGFTTICIGPERGRDVFVHHTGIRPKVSNYGTLVKGEYVNFNVTNGHNGQQAVDVTGIGGGMLMCDVKGNQIKRPAPALMAPSETRAAGPTG